MKKILLFIFKKYILKSCLNIKLLSIFIKKKKERKRKVKYESGIDTLLKWTSILHTDTKEKNGEIGCNKHS